MIRGLVAAALFLTPALASAQAGADIVVLGEVHDNPAHHLEQARIIAALNPRAMVFEMLPGDAPLRVVGVDRTDSDAMAQALGWADLGWPDYAMYHPIFAAAPGAGLFGAAMPDDAITLAMEQGAAALIDAGRFGFDLGALPPADQTAREAEMQDAHCGAMPPGLLPGMVEVQRARDALMAAVALGALERVGGPVVVITGTGHARTDHGVPALIAQARPDLSVWALGQFESDPGPDAPFDAVNITPAAPRGDPCRAFGPPI